MIIVICVKKQKKQGLSVTSTDPVVTMSSVIPYDTLKESPSFDEKIVPL